MNVQTGKISPQYHVILYNKFETVNSLSATDSLDKQWAQIFCLEQECFLHVDYDKNRNAIQPLLIELIKKFSKANAKTPEFRPLPIFEPTQNHRENKDEDVSLLPQPRTPISDTGFQEIAAPRGVTENAEEYAPEANPFPPATAKATPSDSDPITPTAIAINQSESGHPCRNVGTYKDGPANIRKFLVEGELFDFAFSIISNWEHPVPVVANRGQISKQFHHQQKINKGFLAKCYLLQDPWFEDPTCSTCLSNNLTLDSWESDHPTFIDVSDPRILAARTKTSKYNDDNPSFDTATGPFQAKFWQAMGVELNTLENEFDCWELVPLPGNSKENNVLPSTWAFKIKHYPNGQVKKFKA